ncbi:hypothetical protein ACN47E_002164 [Coniothyrium glycines]
MIRPWRFRDTGEVDFDGTHWTISVIKLTVLWVYSTVSTYLFPQHLWTICGVSVLLYNFVLSWHVVHIWMQKKITHVVRYNANAWRWRDLAIDTVLLQTSEKLDRSRYRNSAKFLWWMLHQLSVAVTSKMFRNIIYTSAVSQIIHPSNKLLHHLSRWNFVIVLLSFSFRKWSKCFTPNPTPYKYAPLEHPEDIRIVLLYPRLGFGKVCCSLLQGPHMQIYNYEAMSYTWNSMDTTKEILVDGHTMRVTESVYEILTTYSSLFLPRLLWIDALCINQEDRAEKSKQVPLMSKIYRNAILTTVFLGNSQSAGYRAAVSKMPLINRYNGLRPHEPFIGAHYEDSRLALDLLKELRVLQAGALRDPDMAAYRTFEKLGLSQSKRHQWRALNDLLQHAWFGRVWIIQEVALSDTVVIRYGDGTISWDDLVKGMRALKSAYPFRFWLDLEHEVRLAHFENTSLGNVFRIHAYREVDRRNHVDFGNDASLTRLLEDSAHFSATNPRDLVYGFMSMCTSPLTVNYENPLEDIFLDVAKRLIAEKSLSFLFHAGGISNRKLGHNEVVRLPSWVPYWSSRPKYSRLEGKFSAGGTGWCEIRVSNNNSLITSGIFVDTISEVGPELFETDPDAAVSFAHEFLSFVRNYQTCLDMLADRFGSIDHVPYDKSLITQSVLGAFERTLFLDNPPLTGYKVAQERLQTALKWLQDTTTAPAWRQTTPQMIARDEHTFREVELLKEAIHLMRHYCGRRRFFISKAGYIGLCPSYTAKDDQVFVLPGVQIPVLLRPYFDAKGLVTSKRFELVGESYVHGSMRGTVITKDAIHEKLEIV